MWDSGGMEKLEHSHDPVAIATRLKNGRNPSYLRDFIYGGIDGAVTTFAIVAGVVGAALSSKVILILGLANLLADGFSMAASNYSGMKTEVDDRARLREVERKHVRLDPDGEREEVRQILAEMGLSGETLGNAVAHITSNEKRWVDLMLVEEYGLAPQDGSPLKAAMVTFIAFLICGSVPLIPFALGLENGFEIAIVMTGLVFFIIGAAKAKWSLAPWWRSGLETLIIGGAAASMAYIVGYLLKGFG